MPKQSALYVFKTRQYMISVHARYQYLVNIEFQQNVKCVSFVGGDSTRNKDPYQQSTCQPGFS